MITHGIARLQSQINMMAKTRRKRGKNNKSHNVTEVMQRGKEDEKKNGQAPDTVNGKKKKPMHTIVKSFLPSSVIVS